ncbi:hypothetical protein [Vibrio sp. MACH09]|uniref:hypothetical protein n=1 Tax=Vibrio sp. MACH09 TaxID=3025122 RepID=UPI00295F3E0A|nr:hypothetical protein [Vibrio sp. MACH09]
MKKLTYDLQLAVCRDDIKATMDNDCCHYRGLGLNAEESPHNFYPHQALKSIRAPCFVI